MIRPIYERMALRIPLAIGLALPAIVGIFNNASISNEAFANSPAGSDGGALHVSSSSESVASPILPESFVALKLTPLRPCLTGAAGTTADRGGESAVVRSRTRSEIERRSVLVAARVLEKYLPFRESLTSP